MHVSENVNQNVVGIDVSKDTLDVVFIQGTVDGYLKLLSLVIP